VNVGQEKPNCGASRKGKPSDRNVTEHDTWFEGCPGVYIVSGRRDPWLGPRGAPRWLGPEDNQWIGDLNLGFGMLQFLTEREVEVKTEDI
jgi:hypothetical protein